MRSSELMVGILLAAGALLAPAARASIDWMVFFRDKDCAITVEALNVITEVAKLVKENGVTHLVLEGNAGDEGTPSDIMRLSQCRGDAVRAQLVNDGVNPAIIAVIAKGNSEPWPHDAPDWRPV